MITNNVLSAVLYSQLCDADTAYVEWYPEANATFTHAAILSLRLGSHSTMRLSVGGPTTGCHSNQSGWQMVAKIYLWNDENILPCQSYHHTTEGFLFPGEPC